MHSLLLEHKERQDVQKEPLSGSAMTSDGIMEAPSTDISVAEAGGSPALQATAWGGNARFNPSGKAAVSVGVQPPTWPFFKQLTAMSDLLLHMRCPTLRTIANPGSAHFPSTH